MGTKYEDVQPMRLKRVRLAAKLIERKYQIRIPIVPSANRNIPQ